MSEGSIPAAAPVAAPPVTASWLAVPLMLSAMLCFTAMDSTLKYLSATNPIGQLVFGRNLVQVMVLAGVARALVPAALRTHRLGLHVLRGACLVATTVFMTLSLHNLPMAQTYALTFSAPLLATLLALFALGEHPRPLQWVCLVAGFCGVMIALDPAGSLSLALLFPLAMASANAVFYVLTRFSGRTESAIALVFWAGLSALVLCTPGLLGYAPMPAQHWMLLIGGSLLGTCGQLMMAGAFRRAPTAVVAPLLYSQIVWAMLVGYLVFGETPTISAAIGAAIVALSGIGVVRFARPS